MRVALYLVASVANVMLARGPVVSWQFAATLLVAVALGTAAGVEAADLLRSRREARHAR